MKRILFLLLISLNSFAQSYEAMAPFSKDSYNIRSNESCARQVAQALIADPRYQDLNNLSITGVEEEFSAGVHQKNKHSVRLVDGNGIHYVLSVTLNSYRSETELHCSLRRARLIRTEYFSDSFWGGPIIFEIVI